MFGTRKRLADIERKVDELVRALDKERAPAPPDSASVFASLLGKQLENQGDLVTAFGEIAVKASARRAGIRGGKSRAASAERDQNGKYLPKRRIQENRCPLCVDPMHRPVSVEMIQRHRQHEMMGAKYATAQNNMGPEPAASADESDRDNERAQSDVRR